MSKTEKRFRDAGTGRIVTREYAAANPNTTVAETVKPIVSSNLASAEYDAASQMLIVTFTNGTAYRYPNFQQDLWKEFEATFDGRNGSAGSFFAKRIRFLLNEKIEDDDEA